MNNNAFKSALVFGFAVALCNFIPIVKSFAPIFTGFAAGFFATKLYIKAAGINYQLKIINGLKIGLLTAFIGSFFSVIIDAFFTFIFRTNDFVKGYAIIKTELNEFFSKYPEKAFQLLDSMVYDIETSGFSWLYVFFMIFNYLFFFSILCSLGALICSFLHNSKIKNNVIEL